MQRPNGGPAEKDERKRNLPTLKPRIRAGLAAPRRPLHGRSSSMHPPARQRLLTTPSTSAVSATHEQARGVLGKRAAPKSVVQPGPSSDLKEYFTVLYTKRSKKKHKTYQDGYLLLQNDRKVELQNEDGKKISSANFGKPLGGLKDGNTLEIGTFELEVQSKVNSDVYLSGRLFLQNVNVSVAPNIPVRNPSVSKVTSKFKPLRTKNALVNSKCKAEITPLHDMKSPHAVLLQKSLGNLCGKRTVSIVLDPYLGKHMRPHQCEGVLFLYKCVQGASELGESNTHGAILADAMGLGKSLQSIALIWTLLKQGPFGKPLAKKAIIVCPASLVQNWVNEVKKWLGFERLKPVAVMSGKTSFESKLSLADFLHGNVSRLLIISYEMFRSHANDLYKVDCGILICDEGHRLKSSGGNKTIAALNKIPCRRRVILTGTPVQNDLEEFFAMCNFVNPGTLGSLTSFRTVFANPIIASRDTNASSEAASLGKARGAELYRQTCKFVLRRTSEILEKYLPPKMETAVFCHLSEAQSLLYAKESQEFFSSLSNFQNTAEALRVISRLRKVCSHPSLLKEGGPSVRTDSKSILSSSKVSVALSICKSSNDVGDRLVVVSNFTSTLDILGEALSNFDIKFCRLDGSTPAQSRGDLVRMFNNGGNGDQVFLLSAKAGGVGLNIIGANRLILFDPDWNPATDLQAMARIWRDGQKKHVYVYRLICTGTIEEKILQRQLFKGELQIAIEAVDETEEEFSSFTKNLAGGQSSGINFSAAELRNLFRYDGNRTDLCDTLCVLERSREEAQRGEEDDVHIPVESSLLHAFSRYRAQLEELAPVTGVIPCEEDSVLSTALNGNEDMTGIVSYLYTTRSGNIRSNNSRRAFPKERAAPAREKKKKTPTVINTDSDASDDDLDILLNGKNKALADMKAKYRKRERNNDEHINGNHDDGFPEKENNIPLGHGNHGVPNHGLENGEVDDDDHYRDDITRTRAIENSNEHVCGLTWDEALDVIETDTDGPF